MDAVSFFASLPQPGSWVCWRDARHARCLGWDESYGTGPFKVIRVVDRAAQGIPPGLVLNTKVGERELNSVWFVPKSVSHQGGYFDLKEQAGGVTQCLF